MLLLPAGCDDEGRHQALSFFFDGVPPRRSAAAGKESSVAPEEKTAVGAPVSNWHLHEPIKDCTTCHGNQPRRGTSRKVQLVAQVPQLCYRCHDDSSASAGWVHGPVATGDCLLCHEPHRTRTEALLRKAAPDLCFLCHEPQAILAIQGHAEPSYGRCVDCHEAHASQGRNLLKPGKSQE
jgi:predicted CXXCH cytochrome family protein